MSNAKRCKGCKGQMKKTSEHFEQARHGPIAGWDVTTYTCTCCGATQEERRSVD